MQITNKENLYPTKAGSIVSSDITQHHINSVQQVCPQHTHLVNNKQLHICQYLPFGGRHI
ncbi:hypothetical protein D3C86_1761280 [compost metagenome]